MPVRTFGRADLRVSFPPTLSVRDGTRARNRALTPESVDAGAIEDLLEESGFELIKPLVVRRNARSLTAGVEGISETLDVEVSLRGDEAAAVLLDRDGYLSWHTAKLGDETETATFELDMRAPAQGRAARGLFGEIRAFVLKFSAPIIAGAAIAVLEAGVDESLVHITSTDPKSWTPVEVADLGLPDDGSARILLFVHGTFSSTVGGFGSLATGAGREFLDNAIDSYDAVIGFDHRTLSVDPLANARDLLKRLSTPAADGCVIDVICHSRGGLVVRSLVEQLLPAANWSGSIDRIVFVGVPNAGTNFAEADRWDKLVDVYTNLLLASTPVGNAFLARAIATSAITNVGMLVKYLAAYAVDDNGIPGLAAMQPDSKFIDDLNRDRPGQPDAGRPRFVISSNFHATPQQSKLRAIEGIVDVLLDDANDLVVDATSMAAIDSPPGGHVRDVLDLGANSVVYHTNYFTNADVGKAMQAWLLPTAAGIDLDADLPFDLPPISLDTEMHFRVNGGGVGPPPEALTPPAARTRAHILAEMPGNVVARQSATVRVVLSRNKIKTTAGAVSGEKAIMVDENEALTVQIVPKRNVTVKGNDTARFRLPLDGGISELSFVVKPCSAGPVEVRVIVRRSPTEIVASVMLAAEAHDRDGAAHLQQLVHRQVQMAAESSVDLKDAVWLEISELQRRGYVRYQYELRLPGDAESQRYLSGPLKRRATVAANLFAAIEADWINTADRPKVFMQQLQEHGSDLFEQLFPVEMREKLWQNRNDLKNILLLADEPYFPWELVHLKPPNGPLQRGRSRFLGQYGLIRWQFVPFPEKPELRRRRGRVHSICPDYVDPALRLPAIAKEEKFLKGKLKAVAVPATPPSVREILRNSNVDILHFSGHGVAEPLDVADAKILLRGRLSGNRYARDYISAKTVEARARLKSDDGSGPLVVLNACQVGISGAELSSLGGFARAFLEAGAQAFVSCLWSVREEPSRIFVETLYRRLIAGDSIGESAVRARAAAHTPDDPATWLGFVIYARPDAKFVQR